jgi:hypothetical protein
MKRFDGRKRAEKALAAIKRKIAARRRAGNWDERLTDYYLGKKSSDDVAGNPKMRKNNPFPGVPTNAEDTAGALAQLRELLAPQFPFFKGSVETLGGAHRASIIFTISLDPRESWVNGILENSRYGRFHWLNDGTLEYFSGHGIGKLRKSKVKTAQDVAAKILKMTAAPNPKARKSACGEGKRLKYWIHSQPGEGGYEYGWDGRTPIRLLIRCGVNAPRGAAVAMQLPDRLTQNEGFQQWYKSLPHATRAVIGTKAEVIQFFERLARTPAVGPLVGNPKERTSATSKRAEALRYFESLLRSGVEWADAQWKASQRFGVSAARIAADYDLRYSKNPRGRSKRSIKRPSQATGKTPTKRLVKRRAKSLKAPKGFYANPLDRKIYAHGEARPELRYEVQTQSPAGNWVMSLGTGTLSMAKDHGQYLADKLGQTVRIVDRHK